MINLTEPSAKDYLSSMVDSYQKKYAYLSVNGGGCSGFTYKWDMVDNDENGTVIDDLLVLDQMVRNVCYRLYSRLCKRTWWFLSQSYKSKCKKHNVVVVKVLVFRLDKPKQVCYK